MPTPKKRLALQLKEIAAQARLRQKRPGQESAQNSGLKQKKFRPSVQQLARRNWVKQEKRLAKSIIAGIPEKARAAAEAGRKSCCVLYLQEGHRSHSGRLYGAARTILVWCAKNGFSLKVDPQKGELRAFW